MLKITTRSLSHRVLPTALLLLAACSPGSGASSSTGTDTTMMGAGEPLQLSTVASVGLALTTDAMPGGGAMASGSRSNLRTVDSAGKTAEAVVSGSAAIAHFLIAPNNKVYLAFQGKVDLMTSRYSTNGCLLAEVQKTNGTPICIDLDIEYIEWGINPVRAENPPVQFDNQGAIYYHGQLSNGAVLRRYLNGTTTDLINDNIHIDDFLVTADRSVLITGTTQSSNTRWIRRITPAGGLQNLLTTTSSAFMARFPDGDVYLGIWSQGYAGVYQYSTANNTLGSASSPYIGRALGGVTPKYDVAAFPELQGTNGAYIRRALNTASGKTYAAVDNQGQFPLYQYYPALAKTATTITNVTVLLPISNKLVLAGLNSSSKNKLVIYNTMDDSEQDLLSAYDIEVYHLNYDSADNRIMFDGLNFSDNKYVIGTVELANGAVTLNTLGAGVSAKLADFRTYY